MSGSGRAKREAKRATRELEEETEILKRQREREARRAERLMIRSFRASGGGLFETDRGDTLGTSGVLG